MMVDAEARIRNYSKEDFVSMLEKCVFSNRVSAQCVNSCTDNIFQFNQSQNSVILSKGGDTCIALCLLIPSLSPTLVVSVKRRNLIWPVLPQFSSCILFGNRA